MEVKDIGLIILSLLQFFPVTLLNFFLLLTSNNDFVWGFSLTGVTLSVLVNLLLVSMVGRSVYSVHRSIDALNPWAFLSCVSTFFGLLSYMFCSIHNSLFRMIMFVANISIISYLLGTYAMN
jgi:hypothetical protein